MQLNYKRSGAGQPLIILHGLFGSLDNWQTFAKKMSEQYEVFILDARNHGQSPHSNEWDYDVMANDLYEFIKEHDLKKPVIIGHSMGGKTAMHFTIKHTELIDKLIVVDIAPRQYAPHHDKIIEGLSSLDFNLIKSRNEAEEKLGEFIRDIPTRQFLLKNMYWIEPGKLSWRFNLDVIKEKIRNIGINTIDGKSSDVPVLFIRGGKSDYIKEEDSGSIKKHFPNAEIKTITNAGHWIHAEAPEEFYHMIMEFLK